MATAAGSSSSSSSEDPGATRADLAQLQAVAAQQLVATADPAGAAGPLGAMPRIGSPLGSSLSFFTCLDLRSSVLMGVMLLRRTHASLAGELGSVGHVVKLRCVRAGRVVLLFYFYLVECGPRCTDSCGCGAAPCIRPVWSPGSSCGPRPKNLGAKKPAFRNGRSSMPSTSPCQHTQAPRRHRCCPSCIQCRRSCSCSLHSSRNRCRTTPP